MKPSNVCQETFHQTSYVYVLVFVSTVKDKSEFIIKVVIFRLHLVLYLTGKTIVI